MNTNGIFVAGTDTGVGKTVVAGGIVRYLKDKGFDVNAVKPVESGGSDDAEFLSAASGDPVDEVCASVLEEPLAPRVAAEIEGCDLGYDSVLEHVVSRLSEDGFTVVEGIGGVRVPLDDGKEVIDLIEDLGVPVLIVTRPSLGTLNHTALTVEAVERRSLDVSGIVINRYPENPDTAERTNPDEIEMMTGIDVVGKIPDIGVSEERVTPEEAAKSVRKSLTTEVFGE
ncbi:dethiobiotin synthase [Halorutilales archaeon Cl-col2-1]